MNYSATLLRLTKAVLLVATLLGYCASLPAVSRPQRPDAIMDGAVDTSRAPKLKQLQEASHGTRTHQFPANSIDSLERDMREATTAEAMAETTPSVVTTSGDESSQSSTESTTTTAQPESDESSATLTAKRAAAREHFIQIMRQYYTHPHTGGLEELSAFISLSEMYTLGPLATDPRVDNPPSDSIIENNIERCQEMVDKLNTNRQSGDYCHWTYTCNYNANRFPSMIINATECTTEHGALCIQRINEMQTFSRTFVGIVPTWRKDDIPASVVYGYTCRRAT